MLLLLLQYGSELNDQSKIFALKLSIPLQDSKKEQKIIHGLWHIKAFHLSSRYFLPKAESEINCLCRKSSVFVYLPFFQNGCHSFNDGSKIL